MEERKPCRCNGNKVIIEKTNCPTCNGAGFTNYSRCPQCLGDKYTSFHIKHICDKCNGKGYRDWIDEIRR
ncbi:MAG: hypothetical protein ABFD07_04215 [Methanobacterium sp.]